MSQQFCPYCMAPVEPGETCPSCGLTEGNYTPAPHHLPPGTILSGRYLVGRVLGEGGFGITYIGCDLRLELKVAIKEYFPTDRASRNSSSTLDVVSFTGNAGRGFESGKEKFLFEARTMARMDKQPQIVSVRDFFEGHNTAYIVMEYVEGTTIKEVVAQRGGRIEAQELLTILKPLFSALQAFHDLGLIHRDISPDNLMLENGSIRLLDFGCARESAGGSETMTIALKQGYAPIEQYQQKGQGPWTDVYALAATIYYCLTGKTPPRAVDRICEDEIIPPRKLGVALTESQERVLLRALAVRPRHRYQTAAEFGAALYAPGTSRAKTEVPTDAKGKTGAPASTEVKTGGGIKTELRAESRINLKAEARDVHPPLWRKYVPWIGAAAVLVLAIGLAIALLSGGSDPAPDPIDPTDTGPAAAAQGAVQSAYVYDGEQLLAALGDDSVSNIIICEGLVVPGGDILEITKPVTIEASGDLCSLTAVMVSGGGEITVQGGLSVECGLLSTAGGGAVTVESGGVLNVWKLWLEQETDLTLADGSSLDLYGQSRLATGDQNYIVLSEEALFAQATVVTSWKELHAAAALGTTQAIVIAGGSAITFPDSLDVDVPVLVEEGASVDAGSHRWNVYGASLINRGSIDGVLNLSGDGYTFLNYGTFTSGGFTLNGAGNYINLGDMTLYTLTAKSGDFVNLGTAAFIGGSQSWYFDFRDNNVLNYGVWTLERESGYSDVAYISTDYRFFNAGTLEIGRNAQLSIYGHLENHGTLALTNGSSELQIEGYLVSDDGGSQITAAEGASLYGGGVLIYQDADAVPEAVFGSGVQLICTDTSGSVTWVSSALDLESALSDGSIDLVVAQGVTVPGDLTIGKNLIVEGNFTLSGNVTVTGGAWVYGGTGQISVDGELTVSDNSAVVCRDGLAASSGVSLESGGRLYATTYGSCEIGTSLSVDSGSRCVLMETYPMEHVEISIENGGSLQISGNLYLNDCAVYVAAGGEIRSDYADIHLNGGTSLDNFGSVIFNCNHWINTIELAGDVFNHSSGLLGLDCDGYMLVSGILNNEGELRAQWVSDRGGLVITGTLDNNGVMKLLTDSSQPSLTQNGGVLTGSEPILYTE